LIFSANIGRKSHRLHRLSQKC